MAKTRADLYARPKCDVRSRLEIFQPTEEEKAESYDVRVAAWMGRGLCEKSARIMAVPGMPPFPWAGVSAEGMTNSFEPNLMD